MRKLIIMRGLPGSGKTLTLKKAGLTDFSISTDILRLLHSSPVMSPDGTLGINQENNRLVWNSVFELLEQRMRGGHCSVIDAMHLADSEFSRYLSLSRQYGYEIACVDFTQIPLNVILAANKERTDYRIVPDHVMQRLEKIVRDNPVPPEGVKRIMAQGDFSHIEEIHSWLMPDVKDLSHYREVVHIGDLQGCLSPLKKALPNGIEADKFYIFIGDFCDRGEENAQLVKYMIEHVTGRPNVQTLLGNHEYHLVRELNGEEPVSDEFRLFTKKHFDAHGVTNSDIKTLLSGIKDVFFYTYHGKFVMTSHGGLPKIPEYPWMLPSSQYERGVGRYEQDVDRVFDSLNPDHYFQVHGHRNTQRLPVMNGNSFNLEGSIEMGGHLRVAKLNESGWSAEEYKNDIVRPWRMRLKKGGIVPRWMKEEAASGTIMPEEMLAALRVHSGVKERQSTTYPGISSLSFKKDIFRNKLWDDIVNKARGLFIDTQTGEIVARSYEKFFNIDENSEMEMDTLCERLHFPVRGRLKENGFLGITGYISRTDELFLSTKSSPEGKFAGIFREIWDETLSPGKQEELKHLMRDFECSFVFEVIDPVRDPHMVVYDRPKIILLDIVRRSAAYEKLPYGDIVKLGKHFGFDTAPEMLKFKDRQSFQGWYAKTSQEMDKEIEGYVWQDDKGYMFKTKTPFYVFWKLMRGTKDAVMKEKICLEEVMKPAQKKQLLSKIEKAPESAALPKETKEFFLSKIRAHDASIQYLDEILVAVKDKALPWEELARLVKESLPPRILMSREPEAMEAFLKIRELDFLAQEANGFKDWCFRQSIETLREDIISLRRKYAVSRAEFTSSILDENA